MGLIKSKLKQLPQTIVLDKFIPTTKWCPNCGHRHDMTLDKRTYSCQCGYQEDRDIHSAKNMLSIKNLVLSNFNFVPTEHREITLVEFKTSVDDSNIIDKSEQ
jgi:ribosomal protein S27AE